jgi:hypothetical protein
MTVFPFSSVKNIFCKALAIFVILVCSEIGSAEDSVPTTVATINKTDSLVTSLDRLFKRTDLHRVVVYPEQPDVLQITRTDTDINKGSITGAAWCGFRLLRFHYGHYDYDPGEKVPPDHGWYLADIQSRKVWRLRKLPRGGEIINCSPDGQWLIYKRSPQGKEVVLGRYNIVLGTKEDFVRFKDPFYSPLGEWSPDGTKILFYGKVDLVNVKTSEPVWNIFWLKRELSLNGFEAKWLGDSSGVLLSYQSDPKNNRSERVLAIDRSGDRTKPLEILKNVPSKFGILKTDSAGRVYVVEHTQIGPSRMLTQLRRCALEDKILKCEPAISGDPDVSTAYDLSSDGKVIYYMGDDDDKGVKRRCLWHYDLASKEKNCISTGGEVPLGVSPDGRNLAISKLGESLAVVQIGRSK